MVDEKNAERLTEIEERQSYTERDDGLDYNLVRVEDFNWLVDQVERTQKLDDLIKSHAPEGRNYTNQQYVGLIRDFTRLEEALEFYANEANHTSPIYDEYGQFNGSLVDKDGGEKARQAIKKEEEE